MRIGLVTDFYYPWIAGPAIAIRNLGHGLVDRGHFVSLLAPSPSGRPYRETDEKLDIWRARTVRTPFGYDLRSALWPAGTVGRWMEINDLEVIHIHHPFLLCTTALTVARNRNIPVAVTNHTIPACSLWGLRKTGPLYDVSFRAFARWLVYMLEHCTTVATPTATAAAELRALGFRGQVSVISNGVDVQRFAPGSPNEDLRRRFNLDDRPVVLYTGRLDAEKQLDVWLQAAARIAQQVDAQFLIGGNGAERGKLESLVRQLNLTDRVRFIGYLPDDIFREVYRLASLYLITSPVELQSISTLEAVASGLAVVGVAAGALPELIHEGKNGFVVEPGNVSMVCEAAVRILTAQTLRATMGQWSRAIGLQHDVSVSVDQYERLLAETARSRQGDRSFEPAGIQRPGEPAGV